MHVPLRAVARLATAVSLGMLLLSCSTDVTDPGAKGGTGDGVLAFPLHGPADGPRSTRINTVFDHSENQQYGKTYHVGHVVMAFDGSEAVVPTGWFNQQCEVNGTERFLTLDRAAQASFSPRASYHGAICGRAALSYVGHSGYDYAASYGTPVYAAISGTVHYNQDVSATGDSNLRLHAIEIISDDKRLRVFYIHMASWGPLDQRGATAAIGYYASGSAVPIDCDHYGPKGIRCPREGEKVTSGTSFIGYSGDWFGSAGGVPPHLHFEVQRNDVPGPETLWKTVDPYGWTGGCGDPSGAVNVDLWGGAVPAPTAHFHTTGQTTISDCIEGVDARVGTATTGTLTVTFDATASTAGAGSITRYRWILDTLVAQDNASPTYSKALSPGHHWMQLTVFNTAGVPSTSWSRFTVDPPNACIAPAPAPAERHDAKYPGGKSRTSGTQAANDVLCVPAAPTAFADTIRSSSTADLYWTPPARADSIWLERCSGSQTCTSYARFRALAGTAASAHVTDLAAATIYRFRARAWNLAGSSPYTLELTDSMTSSPMRGQSGG